MNVFQLQILAPLLFIFGMYLQISVSIFFLLVIVFLLVYPKLSYPKFRLFIFFFVGLFRGLFIKHKIENYSYKYTSFKAKISNVQLKDDKIYLTLRDFKYIDNYNSKLLLKLDSRALFPKEAKMHLDIENYENLNQIDEIEIIGRFYLPLPKIPYSMKKNVPRGVIKEYRVTKYKKQSIKDVLRNKLYKTLPFKYAALCCSIFFGDIFSVDLEVKELFAKTGVSYLLGPSILNLSLILFVLFKIFYRILTCFFIKLSKYIPLKIAARLFSFLSILIYCLILGEDFPLLREFIMYNLFLIISLYKKKNQLELLFFTAMITLCIFSDGLYSMSFQLTFGGVLGIFAISKYTKNLILSSLKMTVSSLTCVIPISMYHFYSIALQPYLASLIIMPIFSFVLIPIILIHLLLPCDFCFITRFFIIQICSSIFLVLDLLKNISIFVKFRPFSINYLLCFIIFYIFFAIIKERIRYLFLLFGSMIFAKGVYSGYYFRPFILVNMYNTSLVFNDKIIVYPKAGSMSKMLEEAYNLPCFDGKGSIFFRKNGDELIVLEKFRILTKVPMNIDNYDAFTYILTPNDIMDNFKINIV